MFHLAAYSESQDSATLVNVAALADQSLQVQGDDIIVPDDMPFLLAYYAMGANTTRAQLVSPSMRGTWAEEVSAIDVAAVPNSPYNWAYLGDGAIPLVADEALNFLAAEDAVGVARSTGLVWFCDQTPQPLIGMEIRTVRVTAAITCVANAWTNGTLTFADSLPAGRYALVGARLRGATLQAFRFVFKGGMYRPGGIGIQAPSDIEDPLFRRGRLGSWGEFNHNTPPSIDLLANAADAAQAGELDLVYLR